MQQFDVVVIGAGILGLASAYQLLKEQPHLKLAVIEKESEPARHQTGRNSGVIHSGIYYRPGSLKAKNCLEGVQALKQFCQENEIRYETCGKVIVAVDKTEIPNLEELARRGAANGVEGLRMISAAELRNIEPFAKGVKALHSPNTAIVDFVQVAKEYANKIRQSGAALFFNEKVQEVRIGNDETVIVTDAQEYHCKLMINCAGIYADRVAHLSEKSVNPNQIVPFRGEYYELVKEKRHMIQGLIYPVPDPKFPFLGVHLSKTIQGNVEAGPNAVLAFSREGYKHSDFNLMDCLGCLSYQGFWKMASRHWKIGLYEIYRSFSKKAFLQSLQRLVPAIQEKDLIPGESGVRSQVIKSDGKMEDDFSLVPAARAIHVLNAPSPAATASLSIGKHIASLAMQKLEAL